MLAAETGRWQGKGCEEATFLEECFMDVHLTVGDHVAGGLLDMQKLYELSHIFRCTFEDHQV